MEIILIFIGILFYFLPTFLGYDKKNIGGILMLNLFLGWTFIGWVIAVVWACTNDPEPIVIETKSKKKKKKKEWTKEELQKRLDNLNNEASD